MKGELPSAKFLHSMGAASIIAGLILIFLGMVRSRL